MNTLGARLRAEIDHQAPEGRKRGIGLFLERMGRWEEQTGRTLKGLNYSSIRGYLADKNEPSSDFVEAAASVLELRAAWLQFGEGGRTEADEVIRLTGSDGEDRLELEAVMAVIAEQCPLVESASPPVIAFVKYIYFLYLRRVVKRHNGASWPLDAHLRDSLAADVGGMLAVPKALTDLGVNFEPGGIDNYLVSTCQALLNLFPQVPRTLDLSSTASAESHQR